VETDRMIHDLDKQIIEAKKPLGNPTKYEDYTLPGPKENYTERLLTLPPRPEAVAARIAELRGKPNRTFCRSTGGARS
jgi:hypothetical protein